MLQYILVEKYGTKYALYFMFFLKNLMKLDCNNFIINHNTIILKSWTNII